MPVGIQRLNAKKTQPNDRIIFIKPLPGPDEAIAQDFLERIAAQCLPIMRTHHLSVMSLEEYPPNREFVGRNFNAGEVVQLVLKPRGGGAGRWLPFEYVQMVMMHELAHCKQMNHSRAFWTVRNLYAEQMRALWTRRYTGEGLWGRGALLGTGEWEAGCVQSGEGLPEHLCGGTFRSRRGGKRKVGKEMTSKERREKRILKKFGEGGVALGEDEGEKLRLEGKRVAAKPRVAGSKRGRELRAMAALARFEVKKEEEPEEDSGEEYEEEEEAGGEDAVDLDGKTLLDGKGRRMIKVCEDEDPGDGDAQKELLELQSFGRERAADPGPRVGGRGLGATAVEVKEEDNHDKRLESIPRGVGAGHGNGVGTKQTAVRTKGTTAPLSKPSTEQTAKTKGMTAPLSKPATERRISEFTTASTTASTTTSTTPSNENNNNTTTTTSNGDGVCSVCSFANDKMAPTCAMCANVLHLRSMPGAWACDGQGCQGSSYRNAADCGVCGVCGRRKGT